MADPNWLFSTAAQSAAAFVAIVAGFLVSRLLALSAERNGLESRLRDVRAQLKGKQRDLQEVQDRLLRWDVSDFFDNDTLDLVIEKQGNISLTEVMTEAISCSRSDEELQPFYDKIVAATRNALSLFREDRNDGFESQQQFYDYLERKGLVLSNLERRVYLRVRRFLREQEEKNTRFASAIVPTLSALAMKPEYLRADELNSYRQLERDIELIERDKKSLEAIESDLTDQLTYAGKPEGVNWGLAVLAYFSVVGIILPLALTPMAPDHFSGLFRWGVFILFLSGFLFFFLYLAKLVRQLSN